MLVALHAFRTNALGYSSRAAAFSMQRLEDPATHRTGGTQRLLQQRLALLQDLYLFPQLL